MMPFFDPYSYVRLQGHGLTRGVTMVLPSQRVRELLPHGLELGEQDLTPRGSHPVVLLFHDMFRAHMSIPTLLPNLTYHEHSIGVPFAYITRDWVDHRSPGPYYFMPKLHLDDFWATLGGLLYWGFPKFPARFRVSEGRYEIVSGEGRPITSLETVSETGFMSVHDFPHFAAIKAMLSQPIVSMMPVAMGPFFALSNFDKDWSRAELRSVRTQMRVDQAYVPGLPTGDYPNAGMSNGIQTDALGSYEFRAPWRLSLPYLPGPKWW